MHTASQLQLQRWIACCRLGDVDALEHLYDATATHLLSRVPPFHDPGDAEHMLAGVFMQAWRHAAEYDPELQDPLQWLESFLRGRSTAGELPN